MPPDEPSVPRLPSSVRVNSVDRTRAQVDCLLAVLSRAEPYLTRFVPDEDDPDEYIDEEARDAARRTFELAHEQLRNIIDDQTRWTPEDMSTEHLVRQVLEQSLNHVAEQRKLVAEATRPSALLKPTLRLSSVGWVAWYGSELPTPATLHAVGRSPEEALKKFDEAYHRVAQLSQEPSPKVVRKKRSK